MPTLAVPAGLARGLVTVAAVLASACATPTRVNSLADMSEQQRQTVRAYFGAMSTRDEIYETASGLRRTDPNFLAVKDSMGAMYRDPIVLDWLLVQIANDRDGFMRRWLAAYREGLMRVDDVGGLLMVGSLGAVMSRLDDAQCQEIDALNKSGEKSQGFNALLRYMSDGEVREFFGGMHRVMVAGIQRTPMRAVPTSAQIVSASRRADEALPKPAAGAAANSCRHAGEAMTAVQRIDGADRTHLLTAMLAMAGLAGGNAR